jgi:hypothetical protein
LKNAKRAAKRREEAEAILRMLRYVAFSRCASSSRLFKWGRQLNAFRELPQVIDRDDRKKNDSASPNEKLCPGSASVRIDFWSIEFHVAKSVRERASKCSNAGREKKTCPSVPPCRWLSGEEIDAAKGEEENDNSHEGAKQRIKDHNDLFIPGHSPTLALRASCIKTRRQAQVARKPTHVLVRLRDRCTKSRNQRSDFGRDFDLICVILYWFCTDFDMILSDLDVIFGCKYLVINMRVDSESREAFLVISGDLERSLCPWFALRRAYCSGCLSVAGAAFVWGWEREVNVVT